MSSKAKPSSLIRAAQTAADAAETFAHPLNPESQVRGVSLSELVGLERLGVYLIRVQPGKEAFAFHAHSCEEEFVYVLSGRGVAEIDDQEHEIGPGDFMGYPTPSVAHHIRNPFDEELVYITGGERKDTEIIDFPRLKKKIVRTAGEAHLVESREFKTFWAEGEDG